MNSEECIMELVLLLWLYCRGNKRWWCCEWIL